VLKRIDAENGASAHGGLSTLVPVVLAVGAAVVLFSGKVAIVAVVTVLAVSWVYHRKAVGAMVNWQRPDLEVDAAGYRVGERVTVTYRRQQRRVTGDISGCPMQARLVCQEKVRWRQGADTKADTREVVSQTVTGFANTGPDGVHAEFQFQIPVHAGAPTFTLNSNSVAWFLEVSADGPELPDDRHAFELRVVPALAWVRSPLRDL